MSDNPFKKVEKGIAAAADAIERADQAAAVLLSAPAGTSERDKAREMVEAWIAGDPDRARAVTLEYYSKCDKTGVPRR